MATATSYRPLLVDRLDRESWDQEAHFTDGPAMAACGFTNEQFAELAETIRGAARAGALSRRRAHAGVHLSQPAALTIAPFARP